MQVDFAFLADAAEVTNGKLYVLGGAVDTLWARDVPKRHPRLSFVMRLNMTPAELDRQHTIEVQLMDADGKKVAHVSGNLGVKRGADAPTGRRQAFLAVLNFSNLQFERFGDYSFDIIVNNSSLKDVPLRVAQRTKPA